MNYNTINSAFSPIFTYPRIPERLSPELYPLLDLGEESGSDTDIHQRYKLFFSFLLNILVMLAVKVKRQNLTKSYV